MTHQDTPPTDEEIERALRDQFFSDPKISTDASIDVSVQKGEVTLHGTVTDSGEKRAARSTARLVNGVKSVRDELKVLGPSDADLQRAVLEALQLDSHLPTTIDVNVHEGSVTLTGPVQRQLQRDVATFIAKSVPGVVDVDNQTSVKDHEQDAGDAGEPMVWALDRLADLEGEGLGEGADRSRVELRGRLASAVHRIERLRSDSQAAGNAVRFRLARYIEALESDAVDAIARLSALTNKRSYEEGILESGVIALEADIAVAEAKLDAARAEERDDLHGEMEAEVRAFKAEAAGVKAELDRTFGKRGGPADREDQGTDIKDGDAQR